MASVEKINFDGRTGLGVNISSIVGAGGINDRDDVLVIQGLFNFIAKGLNPASVGLVGLYKIPDVTGDMDGETYSAIGEFQIRNAYRLLSAKSDGRIHPAKYQNTRLSSNSKRFMSITLLHIMAMDVAVMNGNLDYLGGMSSLNAELGGVIALATGRGRFQLDIGNYNIGYIR